MPPKKEAKAKKIVGKGKANTTVKKETEKQVQNISQKVIVYPQGPPIRRRRRGPTRARSPITPSPPRDGGPTAGPSLLASSYPQLTFYRVEAPIQNLGAAPPPLITGPTQSADTTQQGLTSNLEQRLLEMHSKIGTLQGGLKAAKNLLVAQDKELEEFKDRSLGPRIEEVKDEPDTARRRIEFTEEKQPQPRAKRSDYPSSYKYAQAKKMKEAKTSDAAIKRKAFEALKTAFAQRKATTPDLR